MGSRGVKWGRSRRTGSWLSKDGRWIIRPAYKPSARGGSVTRPSHWTVKDTAGLVEPFERRTLADAKAACRSHSW